MRQFSIILLGILFLGSSSAFIFSHQQQASFPDPASDKLMEVAYLWELLVSDYEPNWDRDQTWLDVGIRSKYAKAKKYASLSMVEEAFGMPLFVRGPHVEDMDFANKNSFGYYNPAFVEELRSTFETAIQNPVFKQVLKRVYMQHFAGMAQTYHDAYIFIHEDPGYIEEYLKPRYLEGMARPGGMEEGSFQEEFRDFAEALERNKDADIYEAFTAPAFWLRRSMDGTGYQLFELLEKIRKELTEE